MKLKNSQLQMILSSNHDPLLSSDIAKLRTGDNKSSWIENRGKCDLLLKKKDFTYIQQGYKYVGQINKGTDDFFLLSLNEVKYLKSSHNKREMKF